MQIKDKVFSKDPRIQAGYFHGLQKEIAVRTGISKPVIHKAISEGDASSKLKLKVIQTAVEIIRERQNQPEPIPYAIAEDSESLSFSEPDGTSYVLSPDTIYTYWDYLKWTFLERVELIKGKVVKMSPAPSMGHQVVIGDLYYAFKTFFKQHACRLFIAPFDVRLPVPSGIKDSTVVQPDLTVVCDSNKIDKRGCNGTPDLVVEILSAGNSKHDLETKFNLYEESGVKEYWIVQPEMKTILIYSLQSGKFVGIRPSTIGMWAESLLFPDLRVFVEEIFIGI